MGQILQGFHNVPLFKFGRSRFNNKFCLGIFTTPKHGKHVYVFASDFSFTRTYFCAYVRVFVTSGIRVPYESQSDLLLQFLLGRLPHPSGL
ncbi:unnamed protein product [Allacma fusca]|uniref:Uncharacterized protein n=1 Tax=Allacma fusca TaxID=39272 RepID=A0A8J2L2M6_9HEXA|nr:unnamed protein product [Allacma fusca]